ncbi:MAG: acyltransferase family protein [Burkholderiaceae bacterium]
MPASRLGFVDVIKGVGSQLIVLHHLAFYGPMAVAADAVAPELFDWLSDYARIAVQAFLVVGGFLAARGLAPAGRLQACRPLAVLGRRYLRLALPLIAAVALAVLCSDIARRWMVDEAISAPPTPWQLAAHALLLTDVLGYEALSAGIWYVAIDLQLFALLLGLLYVAARLPRSVAPMPVLSLGAASLLFFNRDASWDVWGLYFFGSYALGALAWWASRDVCSPRWFWAFVALAAVALAIDFRLRIAVALAVAVLLLLATQRGPVAQEALRARVSGFFGRISYSVFLVHFPICLVVNAAFHRFVGTDAWLNVGGLMLAWVASVIAGVQFHRWVESRIPV